MSRCFHHSDLCSCDHQLLSIFDRLHILKCPDCRELLSHIILRKTLRNILCIAIHRNLFPSFLQLRYRKNMIVMTMCQKNCFRTDLLFLQDGDQLFRIICRINEKSSSRFLSFCNITVCDKCPYRDSDYLHLSSYAKPVFYL